MLGTYKACFKHFAAYQFFETVTEEGALRIIDEEATLPVSRFNQICSELIQVLSGKMVEHSTADKTEPAGFTDVIMAHVLDKVDGAITPIIKQLK